MKLETICVLLQHSPIRNYLKLFKVRNYLCSSCNTALLFILTHTHTHTDRRALPGAVNTTPLKHKREQEIDVEKTISTKNPCHLFPTCHFICLVLKYFGRWGLCQSAKLVCHETHNESTRHQRASELRDICLPSSQLSPEIQSLFTWCKISDLLCVALVASSISRFLQERKKYILHNLCAGKSHVVLIFEKIAVAY